MLKNTGIIIDADIPKINFIDQKTRINKPTNRFFYDPWVIDDSFIGSTLENILKLFPHDIGEARIIKLIPGASYLSHADIDDRYHYNIQAEQSYLIDLENKKMHSIFQDNKIWEMDAGIIHTAANFGRFDRLQLVVRKLLKENQIINPLRIKLIVENPSNDYRYKFDNYISSYLNRAVKQGKLNNFTENKNEVIFDFNGEYLFELEKILENNYLGFKIIIER